MADSRPLPTSPDADGDRDSKIERLLLAGLDHYFAGQHERAIGVWTRVLFLDRGHARARAYIERARGALSERLRESDELLHRGVSAFNRGETEEARRLLTSAVERGGPQDVALAFLERIERLDVPDPGTDRPPAGTTPRRRRRAPRRNRVPATPVRWGVPAIVAALLILAAGYVLVTWPDLLNRDGPPFAALGDRPPAGDAMSGPLPVPGPGELAVVRARSLAAQGRVREALRVLDQVPFADAARGEADQLRADLQRALLAGDAVGAAPLPGRRPDLRP